MLNQYFRKFPSRDYKRGDLVIRALDPVDKVFFLEKGLVRQYALTAAGEELTVHIFRSGAYFPLMLILSGTPNSYQFVAETEVNLREIPTEEMVQFLHRNPAFTFELLQKYAAGLNGLSVRLEKVMAAKSEARVNEIIYYLGQKFGVNNEGKIVLPDIFTHKIIASLGGLSRETVSRQIEKLVRKGTVGYYKRKLVIKEMDVLKDSSETEANEFLPE